MSASSFVFSLKHMDDEMEHEFLTSKPDFI